MMFDYFTNSQPPLNLGIKQYGSFRIFKEYYERVLKGLETYAASRDWVVNGKHILVRMINENFKSFGMDDLIYYKIIIDQLERTTRFLGFASIYNKGEWIYNNSYNNSIELYYKTDDMVKIFELERTWRSLIPLEVIYTDNLIIDFPFINTNVMKPNVFIYKINPALLMLQYKKWGEERIKNNRDPDPGTFINQFITPKLFYSYLDYTLFNNFSRILIDKDFKPRFINTTPIGIQDYSGHILRTYQEYIKDYKDQKINIDRTLQNLPLFLKNGYQCLNISSIGFRRQNIWLKYYLRVKSLITIKELLGNKGMETNTLMFADKINANKEYLNYNLTLPDNTNRLMINDFKKDIELVFK